MKVDFHVHTRCSDGVFTVEEVIRRAISEGIKRIAITDHDTVKGIPLAKELSKNKIEFTTGIELTTRERNFSEIETPISIHLLGYGINEEDKELKNVLLEREKRVRIRYDLLCKELSDLGAKIVYEDVRISCGIVMQLCDIENHILKKYYDFVQLEKCITIIKSYGEKLAKENISLEQCIDMIHKAGGKAVMAHPFCVYNLFQKKNISREKVSGIINELKEMGVDGIETCYLSFTNEEREWLYGEAKKRNLLFTGGSDFHGSAVRNVMGVEMN